MLASVPTRLASKTNGVMNSAHPRSTFRYRAGRATSAAAIETTVRTSAPITWSAFAMFPSAPSVRRVKTKNRPINAERARPHGRLTPPLCHANHERLDEWFLTPIDDIRYQGLQPTLHPRARGS